MQVSRYIALRKSSLFWPKLLLWLRIFLFAGVAVYLWQAMAANHQLLAGLAATRVSWHATNILLLLIVLLLLPVNWILEAMKWQQIAGNHQLSLITALRGVILGLALDNFLPASSGAVSGRVMTIRKDARLAVIPGILAGQVMQSAITFLFGLYGFALVWQRAAPYYTWSTNRLVIAAGIMAVLMVAVFFWFDKLVAFLQPLRHYPWRAWGQIFTLSLARYLVFLGQFMLLSLLFAPDLAGGLMFAVATWVFAARTFMPKVSNLERLGIRALAVVFFMGLFKLPASGVLMAVVVLWFVNIAIPSVLGLFLFKNLSARA